MTTEECFEEVNKYFSQFNRFTKKLTKKQVVELMQKDRGVHIIRVVLAGYSWEQEMVTMNEKELAYIDYKNDMIRFYRPDSKQMDRMEEYINLESVSYLDSRYLTEEGGYELTFYTLVDNSNKKFKKVLK